MIDYRPKANRYEQIPYHRCGKSGLMLPALSLGLWHNFRNTPPMATQQSILCKGFDLGITHFDLANNYGSPYGEAERNFVIHMDRTWIPHRGTHGRTGSNRPAQVEENVRALSYPALSAEELSEIEDILSEVSQI